MSDYAAYRQQMSKEATEYEDFVFDLLREHGLTVTRYVSQKWQRKGECSGGIEVKYDRRFVETTNLYIETAEKARPRAGSYAPSGIYREDNSWLYVIGDYETVFIFGKQLLRLVDGLIPENSARRVQTETSQGFLLTPDEQRRYAEKVIEAGGRV